MSEVSGNAALVWQREAMVHQIESTSLWRAQRGADHPDKARNDRASAMLSELAMYVATLESDHPLFTGLLATAGDLRASELVSERLWRYGFSEDDDAAAVVDDLAERVEALRTAEE
jgi:hypothetical protein